MGATTGLTAVAPATGFTAQNQLSFTATSLSQANAGLASVQLNAPSADTTATIKLAAAYNQTDLRYNPDNGHFYGLTASAAAVASTQTAAGNLTQAGQAGYLATITSDADQE